ncbi:MAG: DUF5666 domain-containing protein [Armatimonadota bacterium]
MFTYWKVAWVMAVVAIIATAMPIQAKDDRDGGNATVRVIIRDNDNDDDTRALGNWYGYQSDRYKDTDPETGLRVGNLLQLVTDVNRDRMTVVDRQNRRHTVMLPDRARVVPMQGQGWGWGRDNNNRSPNSKVQVDPRFVLREGDLVIVHGYLMADGTLWATTVRVYGRSYGWENDWDDRPSYKGTRAYGEVRSIDTRRDTVEISTNTGTRTVGLERGGVVLVNGQRQSIEYLRRGDRVVFYYENRTSYGVLSAYRIVALGPNDRYPSGDRPHWADPGNQETDHGGYHGKALEGRLDSINSGLLFNTLEFREYNGRRHNIRAFKSLQAIDRDGDAIPVTRLRSGDRLRIYYSETNGTLFAQRIEVL